MPTRLAFTPYGVIPAALLPFDTALEIDEIAFRSHLRDMADVPGVTAISLNGHSTEVTACSLDEQRRVLAIGMDEIGSRLPIAAGIFTDSSAEAAQIAKMATAEGASALLVFTPRLFAEGAIQRPEMILDFFRHIAAASDLPLILFQFPLGSGMGTPLPTLVRLAEEVPSLCAIKDFSNDPVTAERTLRTLHGLPRPVAILSSHSSWLLGSLVLGAKGILSGAGSTIAQFHVALFDAIQRGDLKGAQAVADRLFPINSVFYADPFLDMHNRMKEAQVLLGRMPAAHVRSPLQKLNQAEIDRIAVALETAGLETVKGTQQ